MKYALISDIHSSKEELLQVFNQIQKVAPDGTVIGLGDLFECTISKKRLDGSTYPLLNDVLLNPKGFEELLDFISIRGNQEERIALVSSSQEPLLSKIKSLPETLSIQGAMLIHGHQWPYNELPPTHIVNTEPLMFYGHNHRSTWYIDGVEQPFEFSSPINLPTQGVIVNVGSVINEKEWMLYDAEQRTITFMKAECI